MKIQLATVTDIPEIIKVGEIMHQESPVYGKHSYDKKHLSQFLLATISNTTGGIVVVAKDDDDKLVGGVIGMVHPYFYTKEKFAMELAVFILPEHRGGTTAPLIFKCFENQAIKMGASRIFVGTNNGFKIDEVKSLYERLGYEHVGYNFTKEVKQ